MLVLLYMLVSRYSQSLSSQINLMIAQAALTRKISVQGFFPAPTDLLRYDPQSDWQLRMKQQKGTESEKGKCRGKWTGRGKDVVNRSERITVGVYMQLRGEWGDRKYKRGRWGKVFGLFSGVMSAVVLAVVFNRATSSHKYQPGEMHQRRERNE